MQDAIFHFDTHHSFDTILDTDLVTPSVPNQLFLFWKQLLQFGGQRPSNLQNEIYIYSNLLSQIFELKSQNRNLNSLLCEIFTYMAVKTRKLQTQRINCSRQNSFNFNSSVVTDELDIAFYSTINSNQTFYMQDVNTLSV